MNIASRQAIRISVELSFDTGTVVLIKCRDVLIGRAKPRTGWDRFFSDPSLVLPEDFTLGKDPPPSDQRNYQ